MQNDPRRRGAASGKDRILGDEIGKEETELALHLRNPHSILAVFRERPKDVIDVRLPAGRPSPSWVEVEAMAKQYRVPVLPSATRDERRRTRGHRDAAGGRGGEAEATVKERPDVSLEVLFGIKPEVEAATQPDDPRTPRLWVALDQIQDPHNVGAIFRSAAFFGIAGIIVTRDRSAPMNATVYDVASGGIEAVPYSNPVNLARALDIAKQAGLWVLGASEHAEQDVRAVDRDRSWVLVLGNEETGLRHLTATTCDEVCRIVSQGTVGSLNVSVAAGVLMAALTMR
jgi:23S rRNA (guanosine2251-2'-O)-methyltransferase